MDRPCWSALAGQLHEEPPAALGQLADTHVTHLADAIRSARHRQAQQLAEASAGALDGVPRILRGPIKKVVGG